MPDNTDRQFPIHKHAGGGSIPWALVEGRDARALRNHSQSLEGLAERGGLMPCELLAIIEDRRWQCMDRDKARQQLKGLIDGQA